MSDPRFLTDEAYNELRTELDEVVARVAKLTITHKSIKEAAAEIDEIQKHAEAALQHLREALA